MEYIKLGEVRLAAIIIFLLWLAGNPCFMLYSSGFFTMCKLAILIVALLMFVKRVRENRFISYSSLLVLFFLIICLYISLWINSDYDNIKTYISYMTFIGTGFLLTECIKAEQFISTYIKVMVLLAVISLFCFCMQLAAPEMIVRFLPCRIEVNSEAAYLASPFFNVILNKAYSGVTLLKRNCGMFWEPGVYQFFLNLAILFLLDKDKETKGDTIRFLIIMIALLTTFSATGFVVAVIIYLSYWEKVCKMIPTKIQLLLVLGCLIILAITNPIDMIKRNISARMDYGIIRRLGMLNFSLEEFTDGFLGGRGFQVNVGTNPFRNLWHCQGIYFMAMVVMGIFKFSKNMLKKYVTFFIVVITATLTEPIIMNMFFMCIVFWGFGKVNDRRQDI